MLNWFLFHSEFNSLPSLTSIYLLQWWIYYNKIFSLSTAFIALLMEVIILPYVSQQNRFTTISHELISLLLCETTTWTAITTIVNLLQLENLESLPHVSRRNFAHLVELSPYNAAYPVILWPVTQTLIHAMFIYYSIRRVSAIVFHTWTMHLLWTMNFF